MRINSSKPKISEYNFLRLLSSTMIIQKQGVIINKYDLEKNLYYFYDNPYFNFLFEDVCKRENIDNNYVDLNVAFQTAYTFGLLILIQDSGDVRAIINLTEEEALKINSEFDFNDVLAMNKLCEELKGLKKDYLFKDFSKSEFKVTEKVRKDAIENPQKYSGCEARIRMSKFYTDEEYSRYLEESLNRELPSQKKLCKRK